VTYAGNLTYQVKDNVCPPGPGNLCNVDPKLASTNLVQFNAMPLASSPLINTANIATGILAIDYRGLPRPANGGYDIGAFQYQGSGDTGGGTSAPDPVFAGSFDS